MREPYLFSGGKESDGGVILTRWMRDVRKLVNQAAAKRGHSIRLGVRVPSRPEVASALGLDAITWAHEGSIDLLVVTPRFSTIEFDMPIQEWRKRLAPSNVTLAGGLEVLYVPYPGGPTSMNTPELAAGAAVAVLSSGADAVYLYNYYQIGTPGWPGPVFQKALKAMNSLDTLLNRPRAVAVTYREHHEPGESYHAPLPATGTELVFPMKLRPVPDDRWACDVLIGMASPPTALPVVVVNDHQCKVCGDVTKTDFVWSRGAFQ